MYLEKALGLLKDRAFRDSLAFGLLAIFISLVSVYYSTNYATESASNSVTDIILSNTRVYDVEVLFVYGALAAVIFSIMVVLSLRLSFAPFILKTASLLMIIRSIFVSLTHISPFPIHATIPESFLTSTALARMFFTGNDLFFSGHVGLTFLMALLLWESPVLRYTYIGISILFAGVVLLGHLHYSIDVFAAYFITYAVYTMSQQLFRKDYERTLL
jgi:hypothetical protein